MNYHEQEIKCCYNCKNHDEEAEGQFNVWCKLMVAEYISPLGICDLYIEE